MDFDTSVVLSEDAVLNVVSPLASFDFSAKVLSALPEGVKAADLGWRRRRHFQVQDRGEVRQEEQPYM